MTARLCAAVFAMTVMPAAPDATGTVRVLSAVGMRQVMLDLGPKFEKASGHALQIEFESSGIIAKRLESGAAIDVVLINQAGIDRLMQARKIAAPVPLATSIVGVAIRAGAGRPDISTAAAFKSAMLAARRVSAPDPALDGSSGVHIANVFARLGITERMKPKVVYADPPAPGASTPASIVADGKADIALHQMQELSGVQGITVVGPLPDDVQQTFVFSAAITEGAIDRTAARALIDFLLTPESRVVVISKGMGLPGGVK
jgi:molybdate transport system substrate-binding protein